MLLLYSKYWMVDFGSGWAGRSGHGTRWAVLVSSFSDLCCSQELHLRFVRSRLSCISFSCSLLISSLFLVLVFLVPEVRLPSPRGRRRPELKAPRSLPLALLGLRHITHGVFQCLKCKPLVYYVP